MNIWAGERVFRWNVRDTATTYIASEIPHVAYS